MTLRRLSKSALRNLMGNKFIQPHTLTQAIDSKVKKEKVAALVISPVKGGLLVNLIGIYDGLHAFLPGKQALVEKRTDIDKLVGQTIECKILNVRPETKNIIVSRKHLS